MPTWAWWGKRDCLARLTGTYRAGLGGGWSASWNIQDPENPQEKKRGEGKCSFTRGRQGEQGCLFFSLSCRVLQRQVFPRPRMPARLAQPSEDWLSIQPLSHPGHRRVTRCVGESCPVGGWSGWVGFLWSSRSRCRCLTHKSPLSRCHSEYPAELRALKKRKPRARYPA